MNKKRISSCITSLSVRTMRFYSDVGSFIYFLPLFWIFMSDIFGFSTVFVRYQGQTDCKFYASMMKSNLLNVQRLLLSSFLWPDLNNIL